MQRANGLDRDSLIETVLGCCVLRNVDAIEVSIANTPV